MQYRLATSADYEALAEIACVCAPELKENFTMQLGPAFQRAYYRIVLAESTTVAVCAVDDSAERVVGFAFGTLDSAALMEAILRNRISLGLAAAFQLAARPQLTVGVAQRALALSGKRGAEEYVVAHGAKVSFLAVRPEARQGRVGPNLMRHVIEALRNAGADAIQAEVDESNPRVIRMHRGLGAELVKEFTTPAGVRRVILEYPSKAACVAA